MTAMSRQQRGANSEQRALALLEQHGYQRVTQNFKTDTGEIDLIVKNQTHLVFVEVKYRADETFAAVLEQITPAQQQRVRRTAQYYMMINGIDEHTTALRFDVIAMVGEPLATHWLTDAF